MSETNGVETPWTCEGVEVLFRGSPLFRIGSECCLCLAQRRGKVERITACLNACEGVDTSALTPGRLGREIVANGKHLDIREGSGV